MVGQRLGGNRLDVAAIEEKARAEGKSVHAWMVGAVRNALE